MNKEQICQAAADLWASLPGNELREDMGIKPKYAGILLYDTPLVGFGAADDPLFETYKKPEVIGPWHLSPREWLPEAQTVISLFFPSSREVRESNRKSKERASDLWAYGRIEGQAYIEAFMDAFAGRLRDLGAQACVPSADSRWRKMVGGQGITGYPEIREDSFGSSWSERHAAYVCGLGTFGLSRGLITRRGMAGRFGSVVIDSVLEPDRRPYEGVYDYCSKCGACILRCPVGAIDKEKGKDHVKCRGVVEGSKAYLAPRYGCGLCQTGVPCETQIPVKAFREQAGNR